MVVVLAIVVAAVAAGIWFQGRQLPHTGDSSRTAGAHPSASDGASGEMPARAHGFASQQPAPIAPPTPTGRFNVAAGEGPVVGSAGRLYRYQIAVEEGSGIDLADFTSLVESTLGDARSWTAGGSVRLQRVGPGAAKDFTVHLATPTTTEQLCLAGGISTVINGVPYTSCRVGINVVFNLDRYLNAVPNYGADLMVYRQYVINHEVGHALGHGHEGCPAAGSPAPVMMQQTLALQGCVPNSWPYLDGKRYAGPPSGP